MKTKIADVMSNDRCFHLSDDVEELPLAQVDDGHFALQQQNY